MEPGVYHEDQDWSGLKLSLLQEWPEERIHGGRQQQHSLCGFMFVSPLGVDTRDELGWT